MGVNERLTAVWRRPVGIAYVDLLGWTDVNGRPDEQGGYARIRLASRVEHIVERTSVEIVEHETTWVMIADMVSVLGQYDPANRWNGWLNPSFDPLAVEEIMAAGSECAEIQGVPDRDHYWREDGALVVRDLFTDEESVTFGDLNVGDVIRHRGSLYRVEDAGDREEGFTLFSLFDFRGTTYANRQEDSEPVERLLHSETVYEADADGLYALGAWGWVWEKDVETESWEAEREFRDLVRAIGSGFHVDTRGEHYASLPDGITAEQVERVILRMVRESANDPYAVALDVITETPLAERMDNNA